jgi:hypothetical protein
MEREYRRGDNRLHGGSFMKDGCLEAEKTKRGNAMRRINTIRLFASAIVFAAGSDSDKRAVIMEFIFWYAFIGFPFLGCWIQKRPPRG